VCVVVHQGGQWVAIVDWHAFSREDLLRFWAYDFIRPVFDYFTVERFKLYRS